MSVRTETRTTLIRVSIGIITLAAPAWAQDSLAVPRSAPHFALFTSAATISGFSLGGSGDFRVSAIPVPLRLSMSFSNANDRRYPYSYGSGERRAMASLELVMRPLPKVFHVQPYFLAGLGVGTMAERIGSSALITADGPVFYTYQQPRETSALFTTGLGLDVGRLFVEARGSAPIAANASPGQHVVNIGFRFWD